MSMPRACAHNCGGAETKTPPSVRERTSEARSTAPAIRAESWSRTPDGARPSCDDARLAGLAPRDRAAIRLLGSHDSDW